VYLLALLLIQIFFFPDIFKLPLAVTNTYPLEGSSINTSESITVRFNRDLSIGEINITDSKGTNYILSKVEEEVISAKPSKVYIPGSYTLTISSDTTILKEIDFTVVEVATIDTEVSGGSEDNMRPALDLSRLSADSPISGDTYSIYYSNGDILVSLNGKDKPTYSLVIGILKSYGVPANYDRLHFSEWPNDYLEGTPEE
jgi:hypothetical protein